MTSLCDDDYYDLGCVRIRNPDGSFDDSAPFDIFRGVLQGDIFSPVAFIAGLMQTFRLHDTPGATYRSVPLHTKSQSVVWNMQTMLLSLFLVWIQPHIDWQQSVKAPGKTPRWKNPSLRLRPCTFIRRTGSQKQVTKKSLTWASNTYVIAAHVIFLQKEASPFTRAVGVTAGKLNDPAQAPLHTKQLSKRKRRRKKNSAHTWKLRASNLKMCSTSCTSAVAFKVTVMILLTWNTEWISLSLFSVISINYGVTLACL